MSALDAAHVEDLPALIFQMLCDLHLQALTFTHIQNLIVLIMSRISFRPDRPTTCLCRGGGTPN